MNTALLSRISHTSAREVASAFIGFLLLATAAQIVIPIQPVPITLQSVAVMIIGLTFTTRAAMSAVLLYLSAAALGAPILNSWSGGMAQLTGMTGGYLFGFIAAVFVMTQARRYFTSQSFLATVANCALGTAIIFAFGLAWLAQYVGLNYAIQVGLLPFILPGVVKALALSASLSFIRRSNN